MKSKETLEKELNRSKREAKEWRRRYEKEAEKRIDEDDLVERVKDVLSVIKPIKPIPLVVPKGHHKPHEAVLLFSDAQIGEKVQSKETGFWNYNIKVFKRELKNL